MSSLNKVMLIGNLGKDPEVRTLSSGKKMANLSIATSERWRDRNSGEQREKTEWHRVSIFNEGLAGIAERYLRKGSKVYLEGALQTRKWTDQEGVDRYTTEVVLGAFGSTLTMLSRSDDTQERTEERPDPAPRQPPPSGGDLDDEIPF